LSDEKARDQRLVSRRRARSVFIIRHLPRDYRWRHLPTTFVHFDSAASERTTAEQNLSYAPSEKCAAYGSSGVCFRFRTVSAVRRAPEMPAAPSAGWITDERRVNNVRDKCPSPERLAAEHVVGLSTARTPFERVISIWSGPTTSG